MNLLEHSDSKIITLTTDFGYRDPFVGQMKGVILTINRHAKIVDITHDVSSHHIEEAAFLINESFKYFPQGSIHVVVVDPGVGSERRALAVSSAGHYFIAPDNGVLSYLFKNNYEAVTIENEKFVLKKNSPTFQGRDLFAPAAAWLSKGLDLRELGTPVKEPIILNIDEPLRIDNRIVGKIIYFDKFGNAITNIKIEAEKIREIYTGKHRLSIVKFYAQSPEKPAALLNSNGFLEIFAYKDSAEKTLELQKGQPVEVFIDG